MKYSVFYRIFALWRPFIALMIFVAVCQSSLIRVYGQGNANGATEKKADVNPERLETNEELSESLANDILELSVAARNRDFDLINLYFPPQITAKPFPSRPTAAKNQVKWV